MRSTLYQSKELSRISGVEKKRIITSYCYLKKCKLSLHSNYIYYNPLVL